MTEEVLRVGKEILAGWSPEAVAEAEAFLAPGRSLDALFDELGRRTLGEGAMRDDLTEAGRRIWRNMVELRSVICRHDSVRAYLAAENAQASDGLSLLAVLASIVQSHTTDMNAALLAAIAIRIGLRDVCRDVP